MSNQLAVSEYMHKDEIIKRFADVVGTREANAYITSVLIAVANNQKLQECTPVSVMTAAMRAATLRLSCDPGLGQAWIVPYSGKATFQIGYKGLYQMAIRTGKYRYLNVSKIYTGEEVVEDRLTGMHSLTGAKTSGDVVGWLLYFELVSGYRKSFYMTREEIHEHARKYSKGYDRQEGAWKTNTQDMERKTVLRLGLTRWGYFDPADRAVIEQAEEEQPIDARFVPADDEAPDEPAQIKPAVIEMTAEEKQAAVQKAMFELGF